MPARQVAGLDRKEAPQVRSSRRPGIVNAACLLAWSLAAASGTLLAQDARPAPLPIVWVLSTGGTIAGRGTTSTSLSNYQSGSLLGEELVRSVPEIKQYANVKVEQILNVSSSDLTVANWLTLARRINAIFAEDPGVAGIVVTHGTNTLEETAYFLNLTVKDNRPVVLVGSQRPATAISADGPLNLPTPSEMIPDTLNPQKARILLMLALARTSHLDQIRRMFEEY
jgi:L-asparaginase/Glu-tRNA(Gln) amidotransferase subunit D